LPALAFLLAAAGVLGALPPDPATGRFPIHLPQALQVVLILPFSGW